jgi:sulfate permease, SulP family
VLIGFKVGVALTLISTQLPKLFGVSGAHGSFWECAQHFFTHLNETNRYSLMIGSAALGVLILGKIFLKNKPVALFVVVGGIIVAWLTNLGAYDVKLLGDVPQGLPRMGLPAVHWHDLNELLPLAMACFLLGAVETSAIGRMFGSKHGDRLDANQEFLALAAANLAAGLGRGFPVSGGTSQSLVNEGAGARTPLSGLVAALLILIVAVFLSNSLKNLPQPVLAAVVLMAVLGLFNVPVLVRLWRTDKSELLIAAVALGGVLTSGLLRGVLIGAVISMLLLIHRAAHPHVAFLGRIPGTRRFSDAQRHEDNELIPGVLIFRSEGSLVYFNADHVRESVLAEVRKSRPAPNVVICDLSAAPIVDLAGAEMLKELAHELHSKDIQLRIVEARSKVRDKLRIEGLEDRIGRIDRFTTVADAVDAMQGGAADGDGPRTRMVPEGEGRQAQGRNGEE